jgi:hypothetical protein
VARRGHGDAGHEIEVAIAVDVLDHRTFAARDDERVLLDVRRRRDTLVPLDERAGLGAGRRGDDPRVASLGGAWSAVRCAREP